MPLALLLHLLEEVHLGSASLLSELDVILGRWRVTARRFVKTTLESSRTAVRLWRMLRRRSTAILVRFLVRTMLLFFSWLPGVGRRTGASVCGGALWQKFQWGDRWLLASWLWLAFTVAVSSVRAFVLFGVLVTTGLCFSTSLARAAGVDRGRLMAGVTIANGKRTNCSS